MWARDSADVGVAASLPYMRTVCVAAPCPRHFSGPPGPESLGWGLGPKHVLLACVSDRGTWLFDEWLLSPRSGLSKGCSGPEHSAFNPNPLARVMLLDSRKCTLNCRLLGIRERVSETSDIAALKLLKFCF